MAATVTVESPQGLNLVKYTLAWTSDGSGNVSEAINIRPGEIRQVKFIPGSGGEQPTAAYDVTLVDSDSVDYLKGNGANLSNLDALAVAIQDNPLIHDGNSLTLTVANAGISKTGTVVVWVGGVRGR